MPQWLQHPNSVNGIAGITIRAELDCQDAVLKKLAALYGQGRCFEGGYQLETVNGYVMTSVSITAQLGVLPAEVLEDSQPCIVAMDFHYTDEAMRRQHLSSSAVAHESCDNVFSLRNAQHTGNTYMRFLPGKSSRPDSFSW